MFIIAMMLVVVYSLVSVVLCYISPIMCPLVCVSIASHARPLLVPPGLQTSAEQDEDCECLL